MYIETKDSADSKTARSDRFDREVTHTTGAIILNASESLHLEQVAEIIIADGIAVIPFNGIYALCGNWDNPGAAHAIIEAKNRPENKNLIAIYPPEDVSLYADLSQVPYSEDQIVALWKYVHALGIILPVSSQSPESLRVVNGDRVTLLNIWTEYRPLRTMMGHFRKLGGRGLVGTSANKSGEGVHFDANSLLLDFRYDVQAVVMADFSHLPHGCQVSTTIIDLTGDRPELYRKGSVSELELRPALRFHGFPDLHVRDDVTSVSPRRSP